MLLTLSGSYSDLLDYVIFAVLLFYILTIAGLFVLSALREACGSAIREQIAYLSQAMTLEPGARRCGIGSRGGSTW